MNQHTRRIVWAVTVLVLAAPAVAEVRYVKSNASGANNGTSWTDAYTDLQSALIVAVSGDEIWITEGTYKPTTSTDRTATFQVGDGVSVYGGFVGTEASRDERPVLPWSGVYENVTTLSGDLAGNDVSLADPLTIPTHPSRVDNSHHVVTVVGSTTDAILDGVNVWGGNTSGAPANEGGAIRVVSGSLLVRNCTMLQNYGGIGGAIRGAPKLLRCRLIGNGASEGGAVYSTCGLTAFYCDFAGNKAVFGGAVRIHGGCTVGLYNCVFRSNRATQSGGAFHGGRPGHSGTFSARNSTFWGNQAEDYAGAIWAQDSTSIVLGNTILWNNPSRLGSTDQGQLNKAGGASLQVYNSCVQGWTGLMTSPSLQGQVISIDPLLLDPDGLDGIGGTDDDDLHLLDGSPCIDYGSETRVPTDLLDVDGDADTSEKIPFDSEGHARIADNPNSYGTNDPAIVDLGADEGSFSQQFLVHTSPVSVPEGGTASLTICLRENPGGAVEATIAPRSGDVSISVQSGGNLSFDSVNWNVEQTVILSAAQDYDFIDGQAQFTISAPSIPSFVLAAVEQDTTLPQQLYVKADATGLQHGLSWEDAFNDLQAALDFAQAAPDRVTAIWVAKGIYRPSQELLPGDSRSAVFSMRAGLPIYGGFAGTESAVNQRDPQTNVTILSGDRGVSGLATDNCYRVVSAGNGLDPNAILDGFTVRDAYANNPTAGTNGGGMKIIDGSPTVCNCTFTANYAGNGAGMYMGKEMLSGGLTNTPRIMNCRFFGNSAAQNGAGLHADKSRPVVVNCTFMGNAAINGAGASFVGCSSCSQSIPYPDLHGCIFIGNRATLEGGAIYNITNSAIFITNCTLTGNVAATTGGVHNENAGSSRLRQSIAWGNSDETGFTTQSQYFDDAESEVSFSFIQGGWAGVGGNNHAEDPLLTPDGHLRSGSPCIDAGDPTFVPDPDAPEDSDGDSRVLDGDSDSTATVDIGADEWSDADFDGMPDWWESMYPSAMTPGEDADSDGFSNLEEYTAYSSCPERPPIYVDLNNAGDPGQDGTLTHPFSTIQAGIDAAQTGGSILVHEGTYSGAGNTTIDFKGKGVMLRAWDGEEVEEPASAVIDSAGAGRTIDLATIGAPLAGIQGITIRNALLATGGGQGAAARLQASRFLMDDCLLTESIAPDGANAVWAGSCALWLKDLTIGPNTGSNNDAVLFHDNVLLSGVCLIASNTALSESSVFDGPGSIQVSSGATFRVRGATIFRSALRGTGTIQIDTGQQLTLAGNGLIDLFNEQGDPGTLNIEGKLLVKDEAVVQKTVITIRQAEVSTAQPVQYNAIHLVDSLSAGGELFVQDNATIADNTITSEGDRYLDLDPAPAGNHPTITGNVLKVEIETEAALDRGTMLELRGQDYDTGGPNNPQSRSGAFPAIGSAGFTADPSANWVIEELTIKWDPQTLQGSKVNLTDRPGLGFHGADRETVYVKKIKLHPHAVLNTALQTLYYEQLVLVDGDGIETVWTGGGPPYPAAFENGAKIVDIPLLGFSLGIIAMNDATASPFNEFDIRVRQRLRDSSDEQPEPPAAPLEGSISLLPDSRAPSDGVMEVRTQGIGRQAASSVAAKGSFARAGEENIVVAFDYQFISDGTAHDAEIVVKLSDNQEVGQSGYEVARVRPPVAGLPGAIGSTDYGIFYLVVPYEAWSSHLSRFNRGTYVELELRGKGAAVYIDNWDPQIICSYTCADYTKNGVSEDDFLVLLAEYGQTVGSDKWCFDTNLSGDGYVDMADLLNWDTYAAGLLNSCGTAGGDEMGSPAPAAAAKKEAGPQAPDMLEGIPAGALVVSGKTNSPGVQSDVLYSIAGDDCTSSGIPPAGGTDSQANGRLVRDSQGKIYQLRASSDDWFPTRGLVRLDDREVVVGSSNNLPSGSNIVKVGVTGGPGAFDGVPISDAVFDPSDPNIVYVAPVLVWVPAAGEPGTDTFVPEHTYRAAAKLVLNPASPGEYSLGQLYGMDPWHDSNANNTKPPEASPYNVQRLREIEIDRTGDWLYVTSAQYRYNGGSELYNEWLLVYDTDTGAETRIAMRDLNNSLKSSGGLLVSAREDKLYLTSSLRNGCKLYRLSISGASVGFDGEIDLFDSSPPNNEYIQQITAIAENPADGKLYAVGFQMPNLDDVSVNSDLWNQHFLNSSSIFATPRLTTIQPATNWASSTVQAVALSTADPDLALPMSAIVNAGAAAVHIDKWWSVRDHGASPLSIELNATATGNGPSGPTVETRSGGIQRIEVDLSGAVESLPHPENVSVTSGASSYPPLPGAVTLSGDKRKLIITFPAAPESGHLPDGQCYTIMIGSGTVSPDLAGEDFDVNVRALVGDANANGTVNLGDALYVKSKIGQAVDAASARFDVDHDGTISLLDVAATMPLITSPARQAVCP